MVEGNFLIKNQILSIINRKKVFSIWALAIYLPEQKDYINTVSIGTFTQKTSILFTVKIFGKHISLYSFEIDYVRALRQELNTQLFFVNNNNHLLPLSFLFGLKRGLLFRGLLKILNDNNMAIYIRQSEGNTVALTVRERNVTDSFFERVKLLLAFLVSLIYRFRKIHFLYEKAGEKYEESASVLFEKLIDLGYSNSYFLISREAIEHFDIKEKYLKNIIIKNSFKHYLYFFSTKTFLGTEALPSAIEVRTISKIAMFYMRYSKWYDLVFLQHGVMYAVSLSSAGREGFHYGKWFPKRTKIVVSSREEAKHFIEEGHYPPLSLYVSGLPKFDRAFMDGDADQIVIMPTWRSWEYIDIQNKPIETTYYEDILELYKAIPDSLKDKVQILVHPSFRGKLDGTPLASLIKEEYNYDAVLRKTKLLITDFSSISFDAFYRGSNVIFWWKHLSDTLSHHGGTLKLDRNNIFGDIFDENSPVELSDLILKNYNSPQDSKYINRYKMLVDFHDNLNTDRLVQYLLADNFLYKSKK